MELKLFKVESADSGSVYTIRMDSSDPSITKFKSQLALFVSIPPQDQILLIGPPYKRLSDSQLGPVTETSLQPQRIYLYNRQVLTGEQGLPAPSRLPPLSVGAPDVDADPSMGTVSDVSALLEKASSPLLRALPDFERQFLRNLKRGEYYFSLSDQIVAVCRRCVSEQVVQIDALQAALSNLKDHYAITKAAFETAQDKLSAQQDKHRALLDSFDEDLDRLRLTPLHSSLINTVGGGEEVYSIAHTGQSMMTVSTSTTQGMSTSPLSPAFMNLRVRGYSMGEEDNVSRMSVSTAQGIGAVAGVGTGVGGGTSPGIRSTTPTMQNAPLAPQQQQRKRDSFTGPSGSLVPGSLEVGSFEEAYPFQTGEITVGREEFADRTERVTLFDCVPSEKEKAWATQCGEVHRKVDEKLSQLLLVFRQVSAGLNNIAVMPFDAPVFQLVFKSLESDLQLQKSAMSKLREDYQFVYDTLSLRASMLSPPAGGTGGALGGGAATSDNAQSSDRQDNVSVSFASANLSEKSNTQSSISSQAPLPLTTTPSLSARTNTSSLQSDSVNITGSEKTTDTSTLQAHTADASPVTSAPPRAEAVDEDGDVMALLKSLESRRKNQESEVISQMVSRCEAMIALKDTVAAKKAELVGTVFGTMRAIASVQTDIQFKLKKGLELMKKWHQGHNKYFIHLEHVAKLPESYTGFLKEIRRRKNFNKVYESKIISLSNEVAALRVEETSAREEFMRSHGGHLPPIFFHMVPSLKDKPPYFDPRLTEAQWLPDVDSGPLDTDTASSGEENVSLGLDIEGRDSADGASEQKGIAAPPPIDPALHDTTRTDTSNTFTPVTIPSNQKPNLSDSESATAPLHLHPAPHTSADARCIELEAQNALLLERVRELTALRDAHSDRAVVTEAVHGAAATTIREVRIGSAWTAKNDGPSAPESRTTTDSFSGLIGTSQGTDPGPVLESSQAISELTEAASGANAAAELTDTNAPTPNPTAPHTTASSDAAQTIAVIARLRTIKTFLDSAAIKSLLDPADQSPETPERSDSAWSALGANSVTVSKAEKSEATGTSGDGTESAGGVEGPGLSGDPLEVLYLLERVTRALLGRIESQKTLLDRPQMTISYREFHLGSLALFMPLSPKMDVYLAFNSKCPHHYLSEESLHLIRSSDRRPPPRLDFIIGRVVFLEQLVAVQNNPYALAPGSKYHLLHVEEIEPSRPLSTTSSRTSGAGAGSVSSKAALASSLPGAGGGSEKSSPSPPKKPWGDTDTDLDTTSQPRGDHVDTVISLLR